MNAECGIKVAFLTAFEKQLYKIFFDQREKNFLPSCLLPLALWFRPTGEKFPSIPNYEFHIRNSSERTTMKKPIIALTPSYGDATVVINRRYMDAIQKSGGIPILINLTYDEDVMLKYAEIADGFLFTGGDDVDPVLFGETVHEGFGDFCHERDTLELPLARRVFELGKPMLGICRGIQTLNVAFGGSLYQDIPIEYSKKISHRQQPPYYIPSHTVSVAEDSLLFDIIGEKEYGTNSMHHQSIKKLAEGWKISAKASDGTIEAIERDGYSFALGLQWHPEHLFATDEKSRRIFETFINACQK